MSTKTGAAAGADLYARLMRAPGFSQLVARAGLPRPPALQRSAGRLQGGGICVGAAQGGRLVGSLSAVLGVLGAGEVAALQPVNGSAPSAYALVFDATGIDTSERLLELHEFFGPTVGSLEPNGRVLVLGTQPESTAGVREYVAQRALEGFTRSLGKELGRRGATVQLVYVASGAEDGMASTLGFLLSPRSAYVSGQVIRLTPPAKGSLVHELDSDRPLSGRTVLVTGAARGIGAAIAQALADRGAHLVGLDVPAAKGELSATMVRLQGEPLALDITAADAPTRLAERFAGGLDVLVHNAGVTVDRTLARMKAERWRRVLDINLSSEERINQELLARGVLRDGARVVCVSSIAGIAGNAGQTNYATSKAGVIGMVQALAPLLADKGATINAVAPGFIETEMTRRMPLVVREAGRRMNSLLQAGLPWDVAQAVAWLVHPGSGALNGNVVRVCGQSLLGA